MQWLTAYTESMTKVIMEHGGFIDDYYGDAIKANFGVPRIGSNNRRVAEDAIKAVTCALSMVDKLKKINQGLMDQGLPPIQMRTGIATGKLNAGCLGSAQRMKYTTVGDVVNTAARLQELGKQQPNQKGRSVIIAAESTVQYLPDGEFSPEFIGEMELKGKSKRITVYIINGPTVV